LTPLSVEPPVANHHDFVPNNKEMVMLNEMVIESTHTLTEISFEFYLDSAGEGDFLSSFDVIGQCKMEGIVLESATEYSYTWAKAQVASLSNQTSSSLDCFEEESVNHMHKCIATIKFPNVTLWSAKKYLVGVAFSMPSLVSQNISSSPIHFINRNESRANTSSPPSESDAELHNHTHASCFGYWQSSYFLNSSLDMSGVLCGSTLDTSESKLLYHNMILDGVFFPINVTLHASPTDTLRDHLTVSSHTHPPLYPHR
jgi:hypothetical protein